MPINFSAEPADISAIDVASQTETTELRFSAQTTPNIETDSAWKSNDVSTRVGEKPGTFLSNSPFSQWWSLFILAVLSIWLVGTLLAVSRFVRGYFLVFRLRPSLRSVSAETQQHVNELARQFDLRNTPQCFESTYVPTPLIMGLCKPMVVLPAGIDECVNSMQLRAMLIHELAHIARRDQWIGLLQRVVTILFWWQPLLYRLNSQLSSVREVLCDNHVIQQQENRLEYARALVALASRIALPSRLPVTIGLLEQSDGLKTRVTRLLDNQQTNEIHMNLGSLSSVAVFCLSATLLFVTTTIRAAHAAPPDKDSHTATVSSKEIRVSSTEELHRALNNAKPGTTILLAPGKYQGGLSLNNLQGTAKLPIRISAADPDQRPIIEGGNTCLHLINPAYVELQHLILKGARSNGLNIDDGGSKETPAHHVVLRGLTIQDIGSNRNHDGIKLSGLNDFLIQNCTVKRWGKNGSGIDMVGCQRGTVSECTFRDGDKIYGNGVQMKGGSRNIRVSHCRFENAGGRAINIGGSTGLEYFRPRPAGFEAKDITVADCTFIGSMAAVAFVGVDGAHVHHNTIYRPTRWVLRILQENKNDSFVPSRKGRFTNNLVVLRSDEIGEVINIGPRTAPDTFQFADNWWYCLNRPEKTQRLVRLPTQETGGTYGRDPKLNDMSAGDLQLHSDSPASDAGPRRQSRP
ncbi:M56 family metallopeptidase [Gimesia alba]|nr:M56 family metallopeptidase [Gimesia alba]